MRRGLGLGAAVFLAAMPVHAAEPDEEGPYEIEFEDYDLGDEAFNPPMFTSIELAGRVYNPADLSDGPFPVVFFLHGWHATCYDPDNPGGVAGDGSFNGGFWIWPCPPQMVSIPSYTGYDYLGELLASQGFIVVSVSANGIAANDNNVESFGMEERALLMNEHLNLWGDWANAGGEPFGGKFVGALDFDNIGAMGHSRGGEGVATWAARDQEDGEPNWIDAVLLLAPVNFFRPVVNNLAISVLLPYCDGDVFTQQGAHYFDDARYAAGDDVTHLYTWVMDGSNHNYYNTIWSPDEFVAGAADDAIFFEPLFGIDSHCGSTGTGRLSEAEQRLNLAAYATAFFRVHLKGEEEFEPFVRGDEIPESALGASPRVDYLAPDDAALRVVVNRIDDDVALQTNELGGDVEVAAVPDYAICGHDFFDDHCMDNDPGTFGGQVWEARNPHVPGLGQLRIAMEEGGTWTNFLPEGTDVSELQVLQIRATPDFESALVGGDVEVTLTDRADNSASVILGEYSDALAPYPGEVVPVYPKKLLTVARLPLTAFEGVDLTDVESITFTAVDGSAAMLLSDLAFSDAVPEDPSGTGTTSSGGGDTGTTSDTGDATGGTSGPPAGTTGGGDETSGTSDAQSGDGSDDGCSCRTSPPPLGIFALLVFGAVRRRHATQAPRGASHKSSKAIPQSVSNGAPNRARVRSAGAAGPTGRDARRDRARPPSPARGS